MKTMRPPGYHYNGSCAQVHELPQSHCGDNRKDTLFSFEHSVCCGSFMTTCIYMYIYICMYICMYIYTYIYTYI